jgi:hypothetical protein
MGEQRQKMTDNNSLIVVVMQESKNDYDSCRRTAKTTEEQLF